MWAGVLAASAGCYLLKLAGLSVPRRLLEGERVQRTAMLLPVALLSGLIAIQTFSGAGRLSLDARAPALAVAAVAVALRAPFIVVVVAAAATAALLRHL